MRRLAEGGGASAGGAAAGAASSASSEPPFLSLSALAVQHLLLPSSKLRQRFVPGSMGPWTTEGPPGVPAQGGGGPTLIPNETQAR
eukprot:3453468-Pyramimonas_sp.AAC.1